MGRSNYGLSGGDRESQQCPAPADCPCGEVAAWYRIDANADAPEQDGGRAPRAVSDITSDGLPSSLCNECFQDAVPESERDRWSRIEVPAAQDGRGSAVFVERRWANQVRPGQGEEDNQDSGEGW